MIGAPVLNHPVDITETIELKLAALRAHESQLGERFAELEPRMREWLAKAGEPHGFAYAEVLHRTEH